MRLTEDEYRTAYSLVPRLCVDLVIRSGDAILLVPRIEKPGIGSWHLPGGRVAIRETLAEAAVRIAKRELNIDVEAGDCLGYMEFLHDVGEYGDFHSLSIVLSARAAQGYTEYGRWHTNAPSPMLETHRNFLLSHGLLRDDED